MTISATLQAIYRNPASTSEFCDVLALSHPSMGSYYLANWHEAVPVSIDGAVRDFLPVPFEAVLPSRDGEGQQDLQLVICNVGEEMTQALDKALAQPTQPIRCRYSVAIIGSTRLQYDPPFELSLTNIALNEVVLTATATRADVINLKFPRVRYDMMAYPGLRRR